ncbi:VOC family protein [Streptococcus oricebi]|uniref:Glyoxalase family protein n=1 Tax=Streptococcus oricebi TaxID=1547447 RepID=A0ABS5B5P6_9STRE|nr:VOC family protein [Streptococcus oricebi]MBP2624145.1 glyoxalase family protein [Streptococcus oricebi]
MNNIPNQIDYIEFSAPDKASFKASQDFYQKVFGWNYQAWGDEYIDTDDSGLSSGITIEPKKAPLVVIYREDLEAALSQVKQAGGQITQGIFEFPGGRRFHFTDPAGTELAIWSQS